MSFLRVKVAARGWLLTLVGVFLFVFAAMTLSSPGRIDIGDGQTRYEIARSLYEHGDSIVRDPRVWFWVLPGRDGGRYSHYRFPQSLAGVPAIALADGTGPVSEGRRHFFFTLISPLACAFLAVTYCVWFRLLGQTPAAAVFCGLAGIFCTPSWFYGTCTFDDILGSAAVVAAVAIAWMSRERRPYLGAAVSGLMLGLAFNCKQPLGIFVLAVLAAQHGSLAALWRQLPRAALMLACVGSGVAVYVLYDLYKFPPSVLGPAHDELVKGYWPNYGNPLDAFVCWAISPGTAVWLYCPTIILSYFGMKRWWGRETWFCGLFIVASLVFMTTCGLTSFFKGDPSWGPRYLTPVFALGWVFVPDAVTGLSRRLVHFVLFLGLLVQLLAVSVDQHRLYIWWAVPSGYLAGYPWCNFDMRLAHVFNRPGEIADILTSDQHAERFTPAVEPTFTVPVLEPLVASGERGPAAVGKYHIFNSLRPWWISQRYLEPADRPVALEATLALEVSLLGVGLALMAAGTTVCGRRTSVCPSEPAIAPAESTDEADRG